MTMSPRSCGCGGAGSLGPEESSVATFLAEFEAAGESGYALEMVSAEDELLVVGCGGGVKVKVLLELLPKPEKPPKLGAEVGGVDASVP
jgi:hypothetical protein